MDLKNNLDIDLDLYSFLSKLLSYVFLAACFIYQFQSQPYIINQDFLYFNLSIVSFVFALIFFLSLDFFGERKYKSLFWCMFIIDVFVLFSIAEFGSLSPLLFSFLLCANILACSLVFSSSLTHIVSGVSCLVFTIFFIRSGLADNSSSVFFFVINLAGMSLISFLGQGLKRKLFQVKEKMDVVLENLKKQRLLNQVIFDSIKSSVFVLDPKGALISTNNRGEDLLSSYKFLVSRLRKVFSNKKTSEGVVELGEQTFSVQRSPLIYKDSLTPIGEIYLATDETRRIELTQKLSEAEKLAAVGRLSAGLAHEIRNPLAGISGSIELLEKSFKNNSETDQRLYKIVMREIDRLNGLVTEFLNFARPEVKKEDSVSIKDLIREVVEVIELDSSFRKLGVKFNMKIDNYLLVVDKNKFKQAIINIIVNAAQATEKSGEARLVTVEGLVKNSNYEIVISDNGAGIKKENLNKIFEPFHTTKAKGTGLGLAITRRILESHGADLTVKSKVGEGTSFFIKIPKKVSEQKFVEEVTKV